MFKDGWSEGNGIIGNASLVSLNPLLDENGHPYLPLMYVFPFGTELEVDQNSALVRPFKKVLTDGKPIGDINYIPFMKKMGNIIFWEHL
jgi:hypothetical protein